MLITFTPGHKSKYTQMNEEIVCTYIYYIIMYTCIIIAYIDIVCLLYMYLFIDNVHGKIDNTWINSRVNTKSIKK